MNQPDSRNLTVVVCGAGPAPQVHRLIELAQRRGWNVGVIATPAALPFIDLPKLETLTGNLVRSQYQQAPGARTRSLPNTDAIVVAPATYNTICKLALSISDNYALSTLAEAIGSGVPVAILPFVNAALARRQPFLAAVESLRAESVHIVYGPEQWQPHPPGTGGQHVDSFPWSAVLDAVPTVNR